MTADVIYLSDFAHPEEVCCVCARRVCWGDCPVDVHARGREACSGNHDVQEATP